MKGKTVWRPAVMWSLELVALTKRKEAELKMLSFPVGVTKMEKI